MGKAVFPLWCSDESTYPSVYGTERLFQCVIFEESQRAALQFCGTHSGRDCDKAKETGLTPVELDGVATFAEAKLVLICKKQYTDMLKPEGFLIPETYQRWYNTDPLHKLFVGEILAAYERTDA